MLHAEEDFKNLKSYFRKFEESKRRAEGNAFTEIVLGNLSKTLDNLRSRTVTELSKLDVRKDSCRKRLVSRVSLITCTPRGD